MFSLVRLHIHLYTG